MPRIKVRRSGAVAIGALAALVAAGAVVGFVGGNGTAAPKAVTSAPAAAPLNDSAGVTGDGFGTKTQIAPVPPDGGGGTPVVPGSPRIVRSADLRVKVAKGGFPAAFDRVASVAAANGGFVSSSSTAADNDSHSGDLTVRVPADRFDTVRQALAGLGKVEGQSIRGEDVSGQLVDYDARLKSLQAQEDALRTLVGQAKAVGDVLAVQSSLFDVRQQIEQLKAQQANLQQATALATIQVSLFEPGAPAVARPVDDRSLSHSFHRAVDGMLAVVGGMVVVVGWLIPVAALGLVVWGGSKVLRRRPVPQPQP
jgi:Domain of unknown function (DUF4349)